jgi:CheY-like chemotaxis protein
MVRDNLFSGQTVLIVEDDAIIRELAAEVIGEAGFQVIEAANADEAIAILETHFDVRVVFTDIDMPGSLNGMRLAARVRDRWPPIEIIVTSGQYFPKKEELPHRAVFIPKPYQLHKVVEKLVEMAQ